MWLDIADRLLRRTAISLSEPDVLTLLATATSDAAGTCWQLKYTHWTARPSQRMPGLRTANADPPFPAYPSGHSTMSRAAAEVLGAVFPRSADALLATAREARDTRLQAGVHFPVDNDAGFVIGTAAARSALAAARLS